MSSTEEYLDSLLRSVMSGKKPPAPIEPPVEEEPAPQPEAQPAVQPEVQPTVQPEVQPVAEPEIQPATEPSVQPEPVEVAAEAVYIMPEEPVAEQTQAPIAGEVPAMEDVQIPVMEDVQMPVMDETPVMPEVPETDTVADVIPEPAPAAREHVSFIGSIMSEIPSADRSAEPEEPVAPAEEPVEAAAEAVYIMPDEPGAPVMDEMPIMDEMPMMEDASVPMPDLAAEMPVMDEMPIMDEMPMMEDASVPMPDLAAEMPVMEEMPMMEEPMMADYGAEMPIMDEMPMMEDASVPMPDLAAEMPVMDEMPMMEEPVMADYGAEMPIMDEMPMMETYDEQAEALPDEDISNLLKTIEEMDSPLDAEPAMDEAPAADEMPMGEELPPADEMPMPDLEAEMPAMDEMPMGDELPLTDEMPVGDELPLTDEVPMGDDLPLTDEMPMGDEIPMAEEEAPVTDEIPMPEDAESAAADGSAADELGTALDDLLGITEEGVDSAYEDAAMGAAADDAGADLGLDELLTGSENDSELSEIGDLLSMDDNNEAVDSSILDRDDEDISEEDILNIDEVLEEDALEENGGKKRKKKKKKKKKEATGEEGEEKPGFFKKIMDVLTKDMDGGEEGTETIAAEDAPQVFEETAKDVAVETAAENAKILDEMGDEEEEGEAKGKKGKKAKKDKKPKEKKVKVKKEIFPDDPSFNRKLPRKNVIVICILCFSLGVVITLVTYLLPYYRDTKKAQSAYDHGNYIEAYTDLKGHTLNRKQQEIYNKSVVILKEKRKLDSYDKYMQLNMPAQALDALLQGLRNADDFGAYAEELGVKEQFDVYTREIESKVTGTFGLDLETAYRWSHIDDAQEYSRQIYEYLAPKGGGGKNLTSDMSENPVIAGEEEEFAQ